MALNMLVRVVHKQRHSHLVSTLQLRKYFINKLAITMSKLKFAKDATAGE